MPITHGKPKTSLHQEMRKLEPRVAPYFAGDVPMTIGEAAGHAFFDRAVFGAMQKTPKTLDLEVSAAHRKPPRKTRRSFRRKPGNLPSAWIENPAEVSRTSCGIYPSPAATKGKITPSRPQPLLTLRERGVYFLHV